MTIERCERCEHSGLPRHPLGSNDRDPRPAVSASCRSRYWSALVASPGKQTNVKREK
ncbi:hypothetical protein DB30_02007 [Enhygromyxa salina]|uniref:Uncharacterized protein n=1 Tax=Enhygromyxa salina TaxID=215803 RepID=A0A0C2D936_9BACT|nr:hypothetical protein DB30_02007 [Enhygromyxa salina]